MIKVCAQPNGTVTYAFGGSTCSCTISTSGGCPCGQRVLDWCSDSSTNDAGVPNLGGDSDGGTPADGRRRMTATWNGTSNGPLWRESYSMASIFGQLKLTITSLGTPVTMGNTTYYPNAHGSAGATLVNINKYVTAPDVQLNVTF